MFDFTSIRTAPKINLFIYLSVFLFPICVATVPTNISNVFYSFLFLSGVFLGWSAWRVIAPWEKNILIGFVIFFIVASLSVVNTNDVSNGLKMIGRYAQFPLLIPMYLLLRKYCVVTGKVFLLGLMLASFVMLGQAIYQMYVLGIWRAYGGNGSIMLGYTTVLVAVVIISGILTLSKNKWHYIATVPIVIIALAVCVMSGTKGALLLLPVIVMLFLSMTWRGIKLLPFSLIVLTILIGILLASYYDNSQIRRIKHAVKEYQAYSSDRSQFKAGSVTTRLELWRNSFEIWKAGPIFGTGIGDFTADSVYLFKTGKSSMAKQYSHAHNIYFHLLATTGVVGLIVMLIFILILPFRMFYSFWCKEEEPWLRFYSLSGMTTIIAFAVFGLTDGWLFRSMFIQLYLMFILVFMSSIAVRREKLAECT